MAMIITIDNYESYFLDYAEQNLTPDQIDKLMLFLEKYPELKEELEGFDNIPLVPDDTVTFEAKQELKKHLSSSAIDQSNYEELFIASHEGDLSEKEENELRKFLKNNDHLKYDYQLFGQLKLRADENIVFDSRRKLKKYPFVLPVGLIARYTTAVAAVLMLVLLSVFLIRNLNMQTETRNTLANLNDPSEEMRVPASSNDNPSPLSNTREDFIQKENQDDKMNDVPEYVSAKTSETFSRDESYFAAATKLKTYSAISLDINEEKSAINRELLTAYQPAYYFTEMAGLNDFKEEAYAVSKEKDKTFIEKFARKRISKTFASLAGDGAIDPNQVFSVWNIADLGVEGINRLTDSNLIIERIKDESGRVQSYALLNNEKIIFERNVKNKE